jgi:succinate-acetate transporter protein
MMSTDTATTTHRSAAPAAEENPVLAGTPAAVGLPAFVVGSVALGLTLVGYVPATAGAAPIAIIAAATALGLVIATVWAAAIGQSAVASIFGIFSGFWLSYAALVLGLTHNWFAIPAESAVKTQGLFLISWLVIVGMLTLGTLRLPFAFSALFLLIDLALVAVLIGTLNSSTGWLKFGGMLVLLFAALGVYLYLGVAAAVTGGKALPLGNPILAP